MNILGLYGSPRKGGNTDILMDEFLKGVLSAKKRAQTERIYIRDLKLGACREYNNCLKTGECIIKDDMTALYDKLLKADMVALSAPIFFYSVPAQVKAMIDRCQALWARKHVLKQAMGPVRKGFFISAGGTRGKNLFAGVKLTVKYFFDAINVKPVGELVYRQIDAKGAIRKHSTALQEAFRAGQAIVK